MKKQIILPIVIIAIAGLVIGGFFLFRSQTSDEIESNNPDTPSTNEIAQTDSTRFAEEYNIATDNIFVYRNSEEIIKILEHGTGIVFLGFPECPWCRAYAPILNDVAKSNGIDKIYYYNIADDRRNNTATYQKLISILNDNLLYDEEGNHRVYVPDITFVKDGKIVAHDNETSVMDDDRTPEEYWTPAAKSTLSKKLTDYVKLIQSDVGCQTTCDA